MKNKIILSIVVIIVLYVTISLLVFRGDFFKIHYYSYETLKECKEKSIYLPNNLDMKIQGDSLMQVKNIQEKFYCCKSMYQKFYGILIHINKEDKELRRIQWEEPISDALKRNWIIKMNGEYQGEAFYTGGFDAKIGETVLIEVENKKTNYKIGEIKIKIR